MTENLRSLLSSATKVSGRDPRVARPGGSWMPLAPSESAQVPKDLYGPPEGWDYRTAKTDWEGKPLPEGATSFDKYGRPYFGGGLSGWWRGLTHKLTAPANNTMSWDEIKNFRQDGKGVLWAVQQTWDKLANTGDEESRPTVLATASRYVGAAIGSVFDLLQVPGIATKELVGGAALGLEAAAEGSPIQPLDLPDWMKDADDDGVWERRLKDGAQIVSGMTVKPVWDLVRAVASPNPDKGEAFTEAYRAGKIAYTLFMEPAKKTEYLRRLDAGEDAGLLAIELGLPGAEAFGEILFDPLNLLTWWTKASRVGKASSAVAKLNIVDDASDVGRGLNSVIDLAKAGDNVRTGEAMKDLSRSVLASVNEAAARNAKLAEARGLWANTAQAASDLKSEMVGEWTRWLMRETADNPEHGMEMLSALTRLGGSEAERLEAIATLMRFKGGAGGKLMFSQNAIDAGTIFQRIDPKRFVDELVDIQKSGATDAEKIGAIDKLYHERMHAATDKMFPTILQRIEGGEDVGGLAASIAKFDNIAQSAVFRPLNTFFATIYMGLSPGFAVRNLLTNAVHIFVDSGVKARFRTAKYAREGRDAWIGTMAARGITAAGGGRSTGILSSFQPFLKISEGVESADRVRVQFDAVEKFMKAAIQEGRALADMAPLRAAGMSDDMLRVLTRRVRDNYGDIQKSIQDVLAMTGDGSVPLHRTALWARAQDIDRVDDIKKGASRLLLDELATAESREDGLSIIQRYYDDIAAEARKAFDETPLLGNSVMDDGLESGRDVLLYAQQAKDLGYINETKRALTSTRIFANDVAKNNYLNAITNLESQVTNAGLMAGMNKAQINRYQRLIGTARDIAVREYDTARVRWDGIKEAIFALQERMYRIPRGQGVPNVANEWKLLGLPGEAPARMTAKELMSAAWDNAYAEANRMFSMARERTVAASEAVFDDVSDLFKQINAQSIDGTSLQNARRANEEARYWQKATRTGGGNVLPPHGAGPMSEARSWAEQLTAPTARQDDITKLFDRLKQQFSDSWGKSVRASAGDGLDEALAAWAKNTEPRMTEARLMARMTAKEAADFTLLNYSDRRNFDTGLGYLYMYPYWHSRTYANWMRRMVRAPGVVAAYAKYREALEQIHAGAPDWWKYQVNTNELLGLDHENPMFFNLEATLNPLNGLVGVDFEDRDRRKSWLAELTQDLGRFGPSPWTPLNWIAALGLHMKGEEEAAQKVGGTLLPISRPVRAITSMLGVNEGRGVQIDPFVGLLYGGLDPWERGRVGRALAAMVNEGLPEADAIEAARTQSGEVWDEAIARGLSQTNWGNLASYTLGVGFKNRTVSDMQIDKFYRDYFRLWEARDTLSQTEWSAKMNELKANYPFMDTLLISRKGGPERDTAYAYNVLQRIPPSGSDELFGVAGLPRELLNKFYESKGDMRDWSASDRNRFMSAATDLGAILDIPSNATRVEWRAAKDAYSAMIDEGKALFGADVVDKEEVFYGIGFDTPAKRDAANAFVSANPDLQQYMDWKQEQTITRPQLAPYYGGIDQIRKYLINQMYNEIDRRVGDTSDLWSQYYALKDIGDDAAARAFYRANPQLKQYQQLRDQWTPRIDAAVVALGSKLPVGQPATVRPNVQPQSAGQEDVLNYVQTRQVSEADVISVIGTTAYDIVVDYVSGGASIPSGLRTKLQSYAETLGISYYELLRQIGVLSQ